MSDTIEGTTSDHIEKVLARLLQHWPKTKNSDGMQIFNLLSRKVQIKTKVIITHAQIFFTHMKIKSLKLSHCDAPE
jgi:hypothetical protein